jgi:hypothetical protein
MRNLPVGRQKFGLIEFSVIDPLRNNGRSVVRLSSDNERDPASVTIPVNGCTGQSLYFLHATGAMSAYLSVVGSYTIVYHDGSEEQIFVRRGKEIGHWWGVESHKDKRRGNHAVDFSMSRLAWQGANPQWSNVGLYMYGWDNPHPQKPVTAIKITATSTGLPNFSLLLAGISFSDKHVYFDETIRSFGLPDCWAQAAVFYAVAEGLAGVEDRGRGFDRVSLAPRWCSSSASRATITMHYPASDGYVSYRFTHSVKSRKITLDITGSFCEADLHVLLPKGVKRVSSVILEGEEIESEISKIEDSCYVDFHLGTLPLGAVEIRY